VDNEKANILYIDDPYNFAAFETAFQSYYNIYTARNPNEAINILRQHSIAVIIAEQNLAGLKGIDFLQAVIPEYPDTIRMLMADANDADLMIKAINNAHVFRYITKPWTEDELKQSIDVAVKIYRLERKNHEYISQMHEEAIKLDRILSLFRKYVPGYGMGDIFSFTKDTDSLFKGESLKITVFFATINNFNQLIENADPQVALEYYNNYFSLISNYIEEHKGLVDKFIGGSILGIFGAPISYINNEKNAVFCAVNLLERLKKFNQEYGAKIGYNTQLSIGINSGEAVVGNIGSDKYISYTAIGDTVNSAGRIVELASEQGSDTILISEAVYSEVKDDFVLEPCGTKEVREKQLSLYKVKGKKLS